MDLLCYEISFDQDGMPTIEKQFMAGHENETLFSPDMIDDPTERTLEGLKLEVAYRILNDYKGLDTSEEYLEEFAEKFLSDSAPGQSFELSPSTIEHWLDKELDAPVEHITGQKQDS